MSNWPFIQNDGHDGRHDGRRRRSGGGGGGGKGGGMMGGSSGEVMVMGADGQMMR